MTSASELIERLKQLQMAAKMISSEAGKCRVDLLDLDVKPDGETLLTLQRTLTWMDLAADNLMIDLGRLTK